MPQSLSNVLVHAVFSTHHRRAVLREELRADVFAYLAATRRHEGILRLQEGLEGGLDQPAVPPCVRLGE